MGSPLINRKNFEKIFLPFRGKKIGFVLMRGNVGDWLIEDSAIQLFHHFNIEFKKINSRNNPDYLNEKACQDIEEFAVNGGGNMGEMYLNDKKIRENLLKYNKPITIFPQTFTASFENLPYKKIWVREKESLLFNSIAELAPDLTLGYIFNGKLKSPIFDKGIFLREDKEKVMFFQNKSDPAKICNSPEEYIILASRYKTIITDRLHFAIAGLIAKREVILLPNSYFKNKSMYDTWLRYFGCKWNPFCI